MPSKTTLALAIVSLIILTSSILAQSALTITPEQFDFGYAPQNSKISHTFELTNTGSDTLHIDRVVPGCSCTKAPLGKTVLAPGEMTKLEITFSTRRYTGRVTKHPRIEVAGSSQPQTAGITANLVARPDSTFPLVVSPYKLDLSQFGERTRDRMRFTLWNRSEHDMELTLIDYPAELLTVTLPAKVAAGDKVSGEITLTREAVSQSFETSITLECNDQARSRFSIPVKRQIKNPTADATETESQAH